MNISVLSQYPFSPEFRKKLEHRFGEILEYIALTDLRDLPKLTLLRRLRSLQTERLVIPLEDEHSRVVLPFLKLIAAMSSAKRIDVLRPDLTATTSRRTSLFRDLGAVIRASGQGQLAAASAKKVLHSLLKEPRNPVPIGKPNRVMFINANLWFGVKAGGSLGHVAGVIRGLCSAGYQVDYFSPSENPLLTDMDVRFVRLDPPRCFGFPLEYTHYAFSRSATTQILRLDCPKYAFIYQRLSLANFTGVSLARRLKIPYVVEYNGSEAWIAKNWGRPLRDHELAVSAENACLRHATAVVTISTVLKDELIARGVQKERIACYPNCVDARIFDPTTFGLDERNSIRHRYGISPDALVIGFVGTFGMWHGVEILAETMNRLKLHDAEWLTRKRVHFLIIGDGVRMGAFKQILGNGQSQFWTLAGLIPQKETPLHLAATDILVSPHVPNRDGSRFFGSPTKLFEYMAMGKAIVASDLDQIGEVLKDSLRAGDLPGTECSGAEGQVAVLCQPSVVDEFLRGIRFLVEHPRWRQLLGRNARDEALRKYTWKTHVARILDTLESVQKGGQC